MNRIVIIGNGFDLAHGLNTSYTDFFNDYWENTINKIREVEIGNPFKNELISLNSINSKINFNINYYSQFNAFILKNKKKANDNIQFRNRFFQKICEEHNDEKLWVDIENFYYDTLVSLIKNKERNRGYDIIKLNKDFERIKSLLIDYLIKIETNYSTQSDNIHCRELNNKIIDIIVSRVKTGDLVNQRQNGTIDVSNVLLLNFNYTNTAKKYGDINSGFFANSNCQVDIIDIHGSLNSSELNPIIFGYGDEMDDDYKILENTRNNKYLDNIKSIMYLETGNYKKFLEFINEQYYQVYIFGHSCGNSDRTLLNTLFEHKFCKSIKVFYHQRDNGDNFREITKNISRNFSSKALIRERVVDKTKCEPLPQLNAKIF